MALVAAGSERGFLMRRLPRYPDFWLTSALLLATILAPGACAAASWMWIWSPGGAHAPETLYFRQDFMLPAKPVSAVLSITADDGFLAYLNGEKRPAAAGADWSTVRRFQVGGLLRKGVNVLAVQCRNVSGPGGLLYKLQVELPHRQEMVFVSDHTVRVTRHPPVLWTGVHFNDRGWSASEELAPANGGVWGALHSAPETDYTRIVRLWNLSPSDGSSGDVYGAARKDGDRMILSTSMAGASDMQILRNVGFTLFQTDSDHLSTEEQAPGKWNWSGPVAAAKLADLMGDGWCYFEHEAFPPPWYRRSPGFTPIECLEHHLPIEAFSPWCALWPDFIDRGYAALARAFAPGATREASSIQGPPRPRPKLSAICVGVSGDYGEAGLFMGGRVATPGQRADWIRRFGNAHDHLGYWCDDAGARKSFRQAMLSKYGSLAGVNAAWDTGYKSDDEIIYPSDLHDEPALPRRRQFLDFVEWYRAGVGHALDLNLAAARKRFPNTLLIVPAGFVDENIRGGNDNSLIPKLAARYRAAVRSIHGGLKPFAENAATMLGRLASACRFYGAPFWTEPPGPLTRDQTIQRIFEAASEGSAGYFDWASNAIANRDVYYEYGKLLQVDAPIVDLAMFYPARAQQMRPAEGFDATFARGCAELRQLANFDIVDDRMVDDGCLSHYRVLALWQGAVCEPETLRRIKKWVNDGGVLLAYDFGRVTTFDGDSSWFHDLFGYIQNLPPPELQSRYQGALPDGYRIDVASPDAESFLDGEWYAPNTAGGVARRWTGALARVLLPVRSGQPYALSIRAVVPRAAAGLQRLVLVNGNKVGELDSAGDVRYRFLVPAGFLEGSPLATLTIQSQTVALPPAQARPSGPVGACVESISMSQVGADESATGPLPGVIERDLHLSHLAASSSNDSWVRRYGQGLTIYFPATRALLRGYVQMIAQADYHLDSIEPGRKNALDVEGEPDGVYATLFHDKILYYNPQDREVDKQVSLDDDDLSEWKGQVDTPLEKSWTVRLPPQSIQTVWLSAPPQELLYECEGFTNLNGLKPEHAPDCSPGVGETCVTVPGGHTITTRFRVAVEGDYRVMVRCLRRQKLARAEIEIDGSPMSARPVREGAVMIEGAAQLSPGLHTLAVRAPVREPLRADFVILCDDPEVAAYDFGMKTLPAP